LREEELMSINCLIRREKQAEHFAVENLVREAFWNVYRPGCLEHYVLHILRTQADFVPELDFVMEREGQLIGQSISFRAAVKADDGRSIPILMLGPICIAPEQQRHGYGKILLSHTFHEAQKLGFGAYCFEGNIDFYGKCGTRLASEYGIRYHGLAEGEDASFFLCKELLPGFLDGVSGEYATPEAYLVDAGEAAEFDKHFPPKTKHSLPGQLFQE